ncbi:MAG: metallophosphoesterase [Haloplasmataceae bacterium]|jgi:predicted MPP superfamily phosphohydrolase|nr:metallophosphoesterase [Haloplasmataceae bacterium]
MTLIYALFEPYWIKIKYYQINGAPSSFKGKKIVFLSDIHNSSISPVRKLDQIVDLVNELNPDIIIFGGDYVSGNQNYVKPLFDKLSILKAEIGIYGVLGNHDFEAGADFVKYQMEKANIKVLENEISEVKINNHEQIIIAGVSDYIYGNPDLLKVSNELSPHQFTILVSHNPDIVGDIKTKDFNLVLSGHTHGGQITIFGLYAPNIPSKYGQKYRTGYIKTLNTQLIVSNGIGCIGLSMRFFARPQIVVIKL